MALRFILFHIQLQQLLFCAMYSEDSLFAENAAKRVGLFDVTDCTLCREIPRVISIHMVQDAIQFLVNYLREFGVLSR